MKKIYQLVTLIAALQQRKAPKKFLMDIAVRGNKCHMTSKFEVQTKTAKRKMAPFVGPYSNGVLIKKEGFAVNEFEPGLIHPKTRATAEELLNQSFGQNVYGDSVTPEERGIAKVAEELNFLDDTVTRREIWMVMKLLTTGVIPIIGEGVNRAITFGNANLEKLFGDALWTSTLSDPIAYLKEKVLEVAKDTGDAIDTLIMSNEAYTAFEKHPKVKDKINHVNAALLVLKPEDVGEGGKLMGYIPELGVSLYTYNEWYLDDESGVEEQMLPASGVIGMKSGSIMMHYGAIALMPKDSDVAELFVMERVPHTERVGQAKTMELHSKPLPVPDDSRGFFFSEVI